ncbi:MULTISPECIES: DICT sensory domain-containing protein [Okeania]|uniref:histidine kinase n=1 Tax=Okeania hirsuta TaxID=1458930 RepID=A0A3N6PDQ0_9CYAN|nr:MULTISPECIES: DICT sensory domain-containing protein [Okeania]NES79559.1 GAF domain-containing protein [Okeania sp. SIO1H4]NES90524.1 GAF domain-containing protein [Okeania sp. SIO2B9]NET23230.1 GAF domain-containing protein [Okeania sp. SIO1H5]NET77972.1 GAF domain-containing protein [Okeania sp. SIO1F9]NET96785.1 GAF domain-containing protein [Okeania sp. SIO1H2]
MTIPKSVLAELVQEIPQLRPQIYFKSSLTALSHAMEDQVLASSDQPLVIATFQQERFYRQEAHRYRRIANLTSQVYVLAAPETAFKNSSEYYETIAFNTKETLSKEWNLLVLGQQYSSCLICNERFNSGKSDETSELIAMDQARRFEGIWTFDRQVCVQAAELLLNRILRYRPQLEEKVQAAREVYSINLDVEMGRKSAKRKSSSNRRYLKKASEVVTQNPQFNDPFAQRLVTYLQASQYKLLKTYRSIAVQEQKQRLINIISNAMRRSLDSDEIIKVAVQELGEALLACRCLIYQCRALDVTVTITHEYLSSSVTSVVNQEWPLQDNPLFQKVVQTQEQVYIEDTSLLPNYCLTETPQGSKIKAKSCLQTLISQWEIKSWLMVPLLYQGRLLGMVELHHCGSCPHHWSDDKIDLVEAIATQLGITLIQAETYAHLEELNQQLEALDRTRSNLIAITGHELRTPLSTIQVCLESLSQEPDMPAELRQVMLETALADADRMRHLVQDFLTLSHLESGTVEWNVEYLPLLECVDLALSSIRAHHLQRDLPNITTQVSTELPLVLADGEWLVEVLSKLLDNACKFTQSEGTVMIGATSNGDNMLEVTVSDTGRGIEPKRLEAVFDRFYQEEGALRRSVGGTGLGLAICRQIITRLGGKIWAESAGKNRGSQFHFTIPIVSNSEKMERENQTRRKESNS